MTETNTGYPESIAQFAGRDIKLGQLKWDKRSMLEVCAVFHAREISESYRMALFDLYREIQSLTINGAGFLAKLRELGQLVEGEELEKYIENFDHHDEVMQLEEAERELGTYHYII